MNVEDSSWKDTFEIITDNIIVSGNNLASKSRYEELFRCHCKPTNATSLVCNDNHCVNVVTMTECIKCYKTCQNQRFQKKQFKNIQVLLTPKKGYGLFANEIIKPRDLIYEYLGEVISHQELLKRSEALNLSSSTQHMYTMELKNKVYVDSRRKGSISRFLNHSCEPNCTLEIWTVNNRLRLGLFALKTIQKGEEITADYDWRPSGGLPTVCHCGTPSCRGYLEVFTDEELKEITNKKGGQWVSCRDIASQGLYYKQNMNYLLNPQQMIGKYIKYLKDQDDEYQEGKIIQYDEDQESYLIQNIFQKFSFNEDLNQKELHWYWYDQQTSSSSIKKRELLPDESMDISPSEEDIQPSETKELLENLLTEASVSAITTTQPPTTTTMSRENIIRQHKIKIKIKFMLAKYILALAQQQYLQQQQQQQQSLVEQSSSQLEPIETSNSELISETNDETATTPNNTNYNTTNKSYEYFANSSYSYGNPLDILQYEEDCCIPQLLKSDMIQITKTFQQFLKDEFDLSSRYIFIHASESNNSSNSYHHSTSQNIVEFDTLLDKDKKSYLKTSFDLEIMGESYQCQSFKRYLRGTYERIQTQLSEYYRKQYQHSLQIQSMTSVYDWRMMITSSSIASSISFSVYNRYIQQVSQDMILSNDFVPVTSLLYLASPTKASFNNNSHSSEDQVNITSTQSIPHLDYLLKRTYELSKSIETSILSRIPMIIKEIKSLTVDQQHVVTIQSLWYAIRLLPSLNDQCVLEVPIILYTLIVFSLKIYQLYQPKESVMLLQLVYNIFYNRYQPIEDTNSSSSGKINNNDLLLLEKYIDKEKTMFINSFYGDIYVFPIIQLVIQTVRNLPEYLEMISKEKQKEKSKDKDKHKHGKHENHEKNEKKTLLSYTIQHLFHVISNKYSELFIILLQQLPLYMCIYPVELLTLSVFSMVTAIVSFETHSHVESTLQEKAITMFFQTIHQILQQYSFRSEDLMKIMLFLIDLFHLQSPLFVSFSWLELPSNPTEPRSLLYDHIYNTLNHVLSSASIVNVRTVTSTNYRTRLHPLTQELIIKQIKDHADENYLEDTELSSEVQEEEKMSLTSDIPTKEIIQSTSDTSMISTNNNLALDLQRIMYLEDDLYFTLITKEELKNIGLSHLLSSGALYPISSIEIKTYFEHNEEYSQMLLLHNNTTSDEMLIPICMKLIPGMKELQKELSKWKSIGAYRGGGLSVKYLTELIQYEGIHARLRSNNTLLTTSSLICPLGFISLPNNQVNSKPKENNSEPIETKFDFTQFLKAPLQGGDNNGNEEELLEDEEDGEEEDEEDGNDDNRKSDKVHKLSKEEKRLRHLRKLPSITCTTSKLLFFAPVHNTLAQYMSSSSSSSIPLPLRWQWCMDLFHIVDELLQQNIYLQWISLDDLAINDTGHLILLGVHSNLYPSNSFSSTKLPFPTEYLHFMAPEILLGGSLSVSSTWYATAITAFLILTGKPFIKNGRSIAKQIDYILKILGTPKAIEYRDYDLLPLASKYPKQLQKQDGSYTESRCRSLKTIQQTLSTEIIHFLTFETMNLPQEHLIEDEGILHLFTKLFCLDPSKRLSSKSFINWKLFTVINTSLQQLFQNHSLEYQISSKTHCYQLTNDSCMKCLTELIQSCETSNLQHGYSKLLFEVAKKRQEFFKINDSSSFVASDSSSLTSSYVEPRMGNIPLPPIVPPPVPLPYFLPRPPPPPPLPVAPLSLAYPTPPTPLPPAPVPPHTSSLAPPPPPPPPPQTKPSEPQPLEPSPRDHKKRDSYELTDPLDPPKHPRTSEQERDPSKYRTEHRYEDNTDDRRDDRRPHDYREDNYRRQSYDYYDGNYRERDRRDSTSFRSRNSRERPPYPRSRDSYPPRERNTQEKDYDKERETQRNPENLPDNTLTNDYNISETKHVDSKPEHPRETREKDRDYKERERSKERARDREQSHRDYPRYSSSYYDQRDRERERERDRDRYYDREKPRDYSYRS